MQFLSAGTREHDPEKWTFSGKIMLKTVPQATVPTAGLQAIENDTNPRELQMSPMSRRLSRFGTIVKGWERHAPKEVARERRAG